MIVVKAHFEIDAAEYERWLAFKERCTREREGYDGGPIGGRFSVTFCETSIGSVVTGRDAVTGAAIDLSGDL